MNGYYAKISAATICVPGCEGNYPACTRCREANNGPKFRKLPLVGVGTTCPLAKYDVQDVTVHAKPPTLKDVYTLCSQCEHGVLKWDKTDFFVDRSRDYNDYCLDCPVNMVEESINETMAEATAEREQASGE